MHGLVPMTRNTGVVLLLLLTMMAMRCDAAVLGRRSGGPPVDIPPPNNNPNTQKPTNPNDIRYNGGHVMVNGVSVYVIYYGTFLSSTTTIIENFISGLGSSSWWNIVRQYYSTDASGLANHVTPSVRLGGHHIDSSHSFGTDVSDHLTGIVSSAIAARNWPADPNGIYVVLTSGDITVNGMCSSFCGFHTYFDYTPGAANIDGGGSAGPNMGAGLSPRAASSSVQLNMAYIGDGSSCPGTLPNPQTGYSQPGCLAGYYRNLTRPTSSINRDQVADSIINILAHEVAETVTDPSFGGWLDGKGNENGDKCNFRFLSVVGTGQDAYNVDFGAAGRFLIQSMWSPVSQSCAQSA